MHYYYGFGSPMMFGYGIFDGIWHVLSIIAVIWLIIALLRGFGGHRGMRMWHTHSALSILNERFAKGEIDKAEYEERKKALMGQ